MKVSSLYLFLLICSGTLGEKENQGTMPKHVAIILDGNRRWAKKNGLKIAEGQEAGCRRALDMTEDVFIEGINTVSLFAFSTENWRRPQVIPNMKDWSFLENFKIYFYPFCDFSFFHQDEVDYWMVIFWIFCQDDDTSSPQVSQHVIFILFLELKKKECIHIKRTLLYNGCKRLFLILLWSVIC